MNDLADEVGATDPQVPMMPDEEIGVRMDKMEQMPCCLLLFRATMVLVAKLIVMLLTVVHVVRSS